MKIFLLALGLILSLYADSAKATAQVPDILIYEGREHPLFTNPLESYYGKDNPSPHFNSPNTANWRGYVATWEIDGGILYLKAIKAWLDGREVGLEQVFPGQPGRIAASWFTGRLRVPQGKMLKYIHLGYLSIYEKDLIITVTAGKVMKTEVVDNQRKIREEGKGGPN